MSVTRRWREGRRRLGPRVSGAAGALPNFEPRCAVGVLVETGRSSPDGCRVVYRGFLSCSADDAALCLVSTRHLALQKYSKMNKLLIALALAPAAALVAPSVPRA